MKKLFIFNSFDYGSTGTICASILSEANQNGFETYYIVGNKPRNNNGDYYIFNRSSKLNRFLASRFPRIDSFVLHFATINSRRVISYIKKNADLINDEIVFNFHNMQFMFLNVIKLIDFALLHHIKIVWNLHDCWPFTGGCWHFTLNNCTKWADSSRCKKCPLCIKSAKSKLINKEARYKKMSENLLVISPCRWMDNNVSSSIMQNCKHVCINNGIDINFWNYKERSFSAKRIKLISVASPWTKSKGLDILNQLSGILPNNYSLTIIGLNDSIKTDKRIIRYGKLEKDKLLEQYNSADIFINPTLEDNFPTVNIEALLCGLPIVSFNTGGSSEIYDSFTGITTKEKTAESILDSLKMIKPSSELSKLCRERGLRFSKERFVNKFFEALNDFCGGDK